MVIGFVPSVNLEILDPAHIDEFAEGRSDWPVFRFVQKLVDELTLSALPPPPHTGTVLLAELLKFHLDFDLEIVKTHKVGNWKIVVLF